MHSASSPMKFQYVACRRIMLLTATWIMMNCHFDELCCFATATMLRCFELHKLQSKESKKSAIGTWPLWKLALGRSAWLYQIGFLQLSIQVMLLLEYTFVWSIQRGRDFFQLVLPKLDCIIFQTKHNNFLINTGASLHHTFNFLEAHILLIHCFL